MGQLSQQQQQQLAQQGCRAEDWSKISLDGTSDLSRIRNVEFRGSVTIGANGGSVSVDGVQLPCGLYDAIISDCVIGADVRIANIGSAVANYEIGDGVVIQDVASLTTDAGSGCGAGTTVETVNEAGGRVVTLIPGLTSQIAYLQALRLHDPALQEKLAGLVKADVEASKKSRGIIGDGASVMHSGIMHNVVIGPFAKVRGSAAIEETTILSCKEHPTVVGDAVQAKHVVIAEGASVAGGAILEKAYVGQAVKIGKQFSAENSLFFANCEGFHGEAVGILAGPYTVTHHKSTLLIAGLFSFYNAGSGTNQSNHMYKLGPVHQGVFERGSKTGSFSYVLHETHVGAFSVVIGKHYTNINTPNLPFAYIHEVDGQSEIVPGMNLFSVGTVRDGEKWPKRDGRKAPNKRDVLTFAVFSPYTVEKMRRGRVALQQLHESTPKEKSTVQIGGVNIKRLLLRKCAKYYSQAITRYVNGSVLDRMEATVANGGDWDSVLGSLKDPGTLSEPMQWTDVAGLLVPVERLRSIEKDVSNGKIRSIEALTRRFEECSATYPADEWTYVCTVFEKESGVQPSAMDPGQARECVRAYGEAASSLLGMTLDDSKKEFDSFAKVGFGIDMSDEERGREFLAVRGSAESNSVVTKLVREKTSLTQRITKFENLLKKY